MSLSPHLLKKNVLDVSGNRSLETGSSITGSTINASVRSAVFTEENLPTNVTTPEQLESLPPTFLSGDPKAPLLFEDEYGETYTYNLRPMAYSVLFILIIELFERFAFYSIIYTQSSYLTGVYSADWNPAMSAVDSSSFVSLSVLVAYTTPFVGALVSDSLLGDYNTILFGTVCFYLPGLIVIVATTVPGLLGETFNTKALTLGLIALWPVGTGIVKSVVNVFGAKQFHPLLQASLIESYYVNFYMCVNVGALVGGIVVPIVAQHNLTAAYCIPTMMLTIGLLCFVAGTPRYVRMKPRGGQFCIHPSNPKAMALRRTSTALLEFSPWKIFKICLLVLPFNITYSQMATTFIVQGNVMRKLFGFWDAATMNNADSLSVLFFGYVIGSYLYPALAQRNIRMATTHKFAIASALGAAAVGWALITDYQIHTGYEKHGEKTTIAWQIVSYVLVGAGEIFGVSTVYEVAYSVAPPERKALASAINIFCIGGISNFLCIGLYNIGAMWFRNARGTTNISDLEDYTTAQVYKYFMVLFIVSLLGVVINLLPSVRDFVASVEEEAQSALKTPISTPRIKFPVRNKDEGGDETTALVNVKRYQNYLKYGSGPVLFHNSSFRAGAVFQANKKKGKPIKFKYIKFPTTEQAFIPPSAPNQAGGTTGSKLERSAP